MTLPISIIIPTLNEEKYLPRLIQSIKNQSAQPLEIIVADADSKDNTKKIAEQLGCRVTKGGYLPKGRNNGAKIAKGEYLIFFDCDVLLPDGFLEKNFAEFTKRKLDICGTLLIPESDNLFDRIGAVICNDYYLLTEKIHPHIYGCCMWARKEFHDKIHGFDEEVFVAEDQDYVLRASKAGAKTDFLRSVKIIMSMRRFEEEGRIKALAKYMLMEFLLIFRGSIKKKIMNFEYGKH